jgi:hypothetical protein
MRELEALAGVGQAPSLLSVERPNLDPTSAGEHRRDLPQRSRSGTPPFATGLGKYRPATAGAHSRHRTAQASKSADAAGSSSVSHGFLGDGSDLRVCLEARRDSRVAAS